MIPLLVFSRLNNRCTIYATGYTSLLQRFFTSISNIASFFNIDFHIASFCFTLDFQYCIVFLHRFSYCIVFLHRFSIASFFAMCHRCCIIYYAHPLLLPFCIVFCDRALCDRALPLPTRKLTGGGIPLLLRLGVLKKGSARLYAKKGLHLPILHRFLISRGDIASFFNIAR
jgi:hypothetical protein